MTLTRGCVQEQGISFPEKAFLQQKTIDILVKYGRLNIPHAWSSTLMLVSLRPIDEGAPAPSQPRRSRPFTHPLCTAVLSGAYGPLTRGKNHPVAAVLEQYFERDLLFVRARDEQPAPLTFPERVLLGRIIAPWVAIGTATVNDARVDRLLRAAQEGVCEASLRQAYGKGVNRLLGPLAIRIAAFLAHEERSGGFPPHLLLAAQFALCLLVRPANLPRRRSPRRCT